MNYQSDQKVVSKMDFYKTQSWKRKRAKILRRDGYECLNCKRYGKNRTANTVHHCHPLKERPDLRLASWNLISLCAECHGKMHDRETDKLTKLGEFWREKVTPHPSSTVE